MSERIEENVVNAQVFEEFKKKIEEAKFSTEMGKHWNSLYESSKLS